ncbi:hypothetical protein AURDEDRAFT_176885 [Auricularia subglabra TFB-10046 SS5]|uniref:Uncharacterized protein n=1 Tax=Auricularia subglabra (strain TFB-10046 / SS5) TaxID=717982 RepID=J0WQB2_AURST|nr:hypothetical protein AURDEDRAFT_176885 [Auricularia subglabra TFB-10046 SS5]
MLLTPPARWHVFLVASPILRPCAVAGLAACILLILQTVLEDVFVEPDDMRARPGRLEDAPVELHDARSGRYRRVRHARGLAMIKRPARAEAVAHNTGQARRVCLRTKHPRICVLPSAKFMTTSAN